MATRSVSKPWPAPPGINSISAPSGAKADRAAPWCAGVQFWPTVFVLDGRGVIRYAGPPDLNTVDRIIEDLLREIEARKS